MSDISQQRKELKRLKKEAHDLCALIWGDMNSAFGNNAAMYDWLGWNTRTGHIGQLTKVELEKLILKLKPMVRKYGRRQQAWWK